MTLPPHQASPPTDRVAISSTLRLRVTIGGWMVLVVVIAIATTVVRQYSVVLANIGVLGVTGAVALAAGYAAAGRGAPQEHIPWRTLFYMLFAVLAVGWILWLLAYATIIGLNIGIRPDEFKHILRVACLACACVSIGGIYARWDDLHGRQQGVALLCCGWMLMGLSIHVDRPVGRAPLLAVYLLVLVVWMFLGRPNEALEPLFGAVVPVIATVIGAVTAARLWSFGIVSAGIGVAAYWAIIAMWITFHSALGFVL